MFNDTSINAFIAVFYGSINCDDARGNLAREVNANHRVMRNQLKPRAFSSQLILHSQSGYIYERLNTPSLIAN